MNEYVIKRGTHGPFKFPKILFGANKMAYTITFKESCKYEIGSDQTDINKLFGIGYFPHHHRNSVRFGWVYNPSKSQTMEIWAYWYDNGERKYEFMCDVPINSPAYYEMTVQYSASVGRYFRLRVVLDKEVVGAKSVVIRPQSLGYLLRPYFGGNKKSPHDMVIDLK
jgi:hypothetical protein